MSVACRSTIVLLALWVARPVGVQGQSGQPKPPLTPQQQALRKEAARLWEEVQQLAYTGKKVEAHAVVTKLLSLLRELWGNYHRDIVAALQILAVLEEGRAEWAAARKALQEVLVIQTRLLGAAHWQVTDARLA